MSHADTFMHLAAQIYCLYLWLKKCANRQWTLWCVSGGAAASSWVCYSTTWTVYTPVFRYEITEWSLINMSAFACAANLGAKFLAVVCSWTFGKWQLKKKKLNKKKRCKREGNYAKTETDFTGKECRSFAGRQHPLEEKKRIFLFCIWKDCRWKLFLIYLANKKLSEKRFPIPSMNNTICSFKQSC